MRALFLFLLAACASSSREAVPASPTPLPESRVATVPVLDPVGDFEFATMTPDGTAVKGVMSIRGAAGAYTGSIDAGAQGAFPIKGVTVSGQTVTINADHPQGPLELRLTFVADDFTGSWQLGAEGGELTGKRKRTP